ncbi:MAG TPA: hypothetical protein VG939_02655, partial [Caulobacteraceae bacterium]|nr:hypothetical protein [Caulobacteraceae bacterium]
GDEALGCDWLWGERFYELRDDPYWGELVTSRAYADFSRGGAGYGSLHPELGEHTVEVLLSFGVEPDRIRALAKDRVIFRR